MLPWHWGDRDRETLGDHWPDSLVYTESSRKLRRDLVPPIKVDVVQKTEYKSDIWQSHAHAHMCNMYLHT